MNNIRFLSENFMFLEVKFSIYLNRRVFVMFFKIVYSDTNSTSPYNGQMSSSDHHVNKSDRY